jgi:hypothetical protein
VERFGEVVVGTEREPAMRSVGALAAVSIRIVAGSSLSVIIRQRCRRARRGSQSRTITA